MISAQDRLTNQTLSTGFIEPPRAYIMPTVRRLLKPEKIRENLVKHFFQLFY
ncbi:MAG: hypothetical protein KJP05_11020 [Deltaproteobacteria bacterium]|nr:hypothetical protein [Deltaproteobacteria bacterium]